MCKKDKSVSLFVLEGQFLGFEMDGYKLKRLRLATSEMEYTIKLSKESRASVGGLLLPGALIQVWGEKTVKDEAIKLKADRIVLLASGQISAPLSCPPEPKATPKATILMCQKSDCMKRGGRALCQALERELGDRHLTDQVTIKGTGCMKQCKAGPNLVMPGKTRYTNVDAADVPQILDRHFPQTQRSLPQTAATLEEAERVAACHA